ncbi:F0F1 ATP synthase subunit epsilon [Desulfoplanes formicivorans]|uniref:F0F1 ATP synthase subunit epsilon n=1 Tax=Desulfoplanes formicivorans TaxID=1592317 RepID=A0A194AK70_9BACT|nr:F0F1 ATP synthase subunit epsilon [Desulfoplanes formicivorans]GAU09456.1 F0F1 ATP synthase subunit epsilon [Desulfoplanes formicivorans]
MHLRIFLPTEIFFDRQVIKITAEGDNGCFCILPRHQDFVTSLVPGIVSVTDTTGTAIHMGVDHGVLVKCMDKVNMAVGNAVIGPSLGVLERTVDEEFSVLDDKERTARSAVARLEAGFIRQFLNMEQ